MVLIDKSPVITYKKASTAHDMVGHGGALVEMMPFNRRVVGSNPALAAM